MRILANDLQFPEGPVYLDDGSVLVVEIRRKTLTRIWGEGRKEIVADLGGGPNGAAIGPDGHCYVCNNGGFKFVEADGKWVIHGPADDYRGGWIDKVDLRTGKSERMYEKAGDELVKGPNDLVFDSTGGFYFTDLGKSRARQVDRGRVYYAAADGSLIKEVIAPMYLPNGVGLSPDGRTLYVTETAFGRLYRWSIIAPGEVQRIEDATRSPPHGGELLFTPTRYEMFDSLAVEEQGAVCVGTLITGGITVIHPDGRPPEFVRIPLDTYITNICFGGRDRKRAFITCSYAGLLVEMEWPRPGLKLAF